MPDITPEQVDHVAWLGRLRFTPEESRAFADQLASILDHFRKLNEVDVGGVEPTSHVLGLRNVMREDSVQPSLPTEELLRIAPDSEDRFVRVPKVLE